MLIKIIYFFLFAHCVLARPRFADLDEEDQHLYRAAYETPNYDHDEYQYQDNGDLPVGKLDLFKDVMWAIKAKLKEIKAVNKAMCASLLSTKFKVKELLEHSIALKKHHHIEKPIYNYQAPAYSPAPVYSHQAPPYPAYIPQAPTYTQFNPLPLHGPEYAEPHFAPPQYTHDPYYGQ